MTERTVVSPPDDLDAHAFSQALRDAGWKLVGRRDGAYERFENQDLAGVARMLVVPLDVSAPDYKTVLTTAWSAAMGSPLERPLSEMLNMRMSNRALDSVRFRKETSAPRGLIAWTQGEELIQAARATLSAGAKAYLGGERRKYGSAFGQFANRYLDAVLMGQTAISSYVVTALTPIDLPIPTTRRSVEHLRVDDDVATGRAVTESVVHAVGATVEAVDHYRSTGSLSGFEDRRATGVSYEIVNALLSLASQADQASVVVEWETARQMAITPNDDVRFDLSGADAATLDKASKMLAVVMDPEPGTTIRGRVHLLSQSHAGGPGTIGVEWRSPSGLRRVRVPLTGDDYHAAVRAHDEELEVVLSGVLEREGNLHWLYNPELLHLRPPDTDSPTMF